MISILAQGISGAVYDIETNEPLEGASVYLNGSSFGTITNKKGQFRLEPKVESTASLIVTHIGYQSVNIEYHHLGEVLKIGMSIEVFEVPEVIVSSDPFSRKQKLELFRKEFLGDFGPADNCSILNEDVIELYFNATENKLFAYAKEPIIVENEYLGYKINFDLREFQVSFRRKSLERLDNIMRTTFRGYSFFEDFTNSNEKFLVRREKIFHGSVQHLMRNIWNQNWIDERFKVKLNHKTRLPHEIFKVSAGTKLENKRVDLPEKMVVVVYKNVLNYRSTMTLLGESHFFIDKYGNYYPHNQVLIGGYLATYRLGDLLPFNYENGQLSN